MNKQLKIAAAAIVCVLLSVAPSARAWNGTGHSAVACIAEKHLTPEAREKCYRYLHHSLPYYASWQDQWRNCKGFEETHYWHSVPVDAQMRSIKSESRNAAVQITRICKQMKKYRKLKDSIVCDNLKLLIHMVGDMHCPSHSKYTETPEYKPYTVYQNGKKLNMHTFWDSSQSFCHKGWSATDIRDNIDVLTADEIALIQTGTPADWAHQNALDMQETFELLPKGCNVEELSPETVEKITRLSDRQIQRGGYRLAHILNTIFK